MSSTQIPPISAPPSTKEVTGFLKNRLWQQRKWIFASLFFALITVGIQVLQNTLAKSFFDKGVLPHDGKKLISICIALVIYFLFEGLVTYFHRYLLRVGAESMVKDMRKEVFDRFLVLSQSQFSKFTSGKAVNHIVSDIQVISQGLHIIADVVQSPLTIIGMLGYLLYLNWKLTLVCFVAIPLIAVTGKALGKSARRNQMRIQRTLEKISNHVIESIRGLRTAHAFNQTPRLQSEFSENLDESYQHYLKLARIEEVVAPLTKWVTSWVGAFIIGFGGFLVIQDAPLVEAGDPRAFTAGALIAFLMAAGRIQQPLRQLNQVNIRFQQVLASAERIFGVLQEKLDPVSASQENFLMSLSSAEPSSRKEHSTHSPSLSLEFEDVSFRYPARDGENFYETSHALRQISLSLEPGMKIALVGRSGSGKSTLSLLALRFLDPTEGQIRLGGKDSKQWDLGEYRNHFAHVSQDVYLFNRSVKENLLFANPNATNEEIHSALKKAEILDFIESLPKKLDTQIGELAGTLSGGEKQRLAIARAFLKNAPFLILDEATSQLDAHSEEGVQQALKELMKGRSAIVIAHRLTTVREVDRVLVMEHGRIIEEGRPSDLLAKQESSFASLWKKQVEGQH